MLKILTFRCFHIQRWIWFTLCRQEAFSLLKKDVKNKKQPMVSRGGMNPCSVNPFETCCGKYRERNSLRASPVSSSSWTLMYYSRCSEHLWWTNNLLDGDALWHSVLTCEVLCDLSAGCHPWKHSFRSRDVKLTLSWLISCTGKVMVLLKLHLDCYYYCRWTKGNKAKRLSLEKFCPI